VARLAVYSRATGFRPATVPLTPADAPLRVMAVATTTDSFSPPNAAAHLTVTASIGSRTVMAEPVLFASQKPQDSGNNVRSFAATVGLITALDDGDYRFTAGFGDAGELDLQSVVLVLRRHVLVADDRAQPIGWVLMAVGVVGFALTLGRGGSAGGGPPAPAPRADGPRWGREGES